MKITVIHWTKALLAAIITGSANSFLSALGISGANAVGIQIAQLDGRQLLSITVIGGLVGMAAYLKQSPVPPDDSTPTTITP